MIEIICACGKTFVKRTCNKWCSANCPKRPPKYVSVNPAVALRRQWHHWNLEQQSETDIAWAAGIFDGEGCVLVYINKQSGAYQLSLTIGMSERRPIDKIQSMFGGSTYRERRQNPKHRDMYRWRVGAAHAEEVLRRMRPFLMCKDIQADIVFSLRETVKRLGANHNHRVTDEIRAAVVSGRDALRLAKRTV